MSDDRCFFGTDKPFRGAPQSRLVWRRPALQDHPQQGNNGAASPQHSQVRTLYGPLEALRDPACDRIAERRPNRPNRVIWVIITAEQQQRRQQRVLLPEVLNELTTNYTCVPKAVQLLPSLHIWPQFESFICVLGRSGPALDWTHPQRLTSRGPFRHL